MRRPLLTALLLSPLAALLVMVAVSRATPSVDSLRTQIQNAGQREHVLTAGVGGTAAVIAAMSGQLSVLSGRVATVQQQLGQDRTRLGALSAEALLQRTRVQRLRGRLFRQRAELAGWLVAVYEAGRPTTIEVLTAAHGFADLLERMDFLARLSEHGGQIAQRLRSARVAAQHGLTRLVALGVAQRQATLAAGAESAALQSMSGALIERRAALDRARRLQLAALGRTRSQRATLQGRLERELAALSAPPPPPAVAAAATPLRGGSAPSGGFSIPWAIVQCESGGQNLPPNASGASGYYQILPATWKGAGGSTAQAFQAPKAEQDAVAARLWAGGTGSSNWVCASPVGGA